MKMKIVGSAVRFGGGALLGLTEAQFLPRAKSLRAIGPDLYEVKSPIEFKAGELLDASIEDVPKHLRENIQIIGAPVPEGDGNITRMKAKARGR